METNMSGNTWQQDSLRRIQVTPAVIDYDVDRYSLLVSHVTHEGKSDFNLRYVCPCSNFQNCKNFHDCMPSSSQLRSQDDGSLPESGQIVLQPTFNSWWRPKPVTLSDIEESFHLWPTCASPASQLCMRKNIRLPFPITVARLQCGSS